MSRPKKTAAGGYISALPNRIFSRRAVSAGEIVRSIHRPSTLPDSPRQCSVAFQLAAYFL